MNAISMLFGPSWKTSVLGVVGGLLTILPQVQNAVTGHAIDLNAVFQGLAIAGVGLSAKDSDVSHSVAPSPGPVKSIVSADSPRNQNAIENVKAKTE